MVWQLLAKPLLGVVADGVKGFVETKKAKQELKLTTIKATQKLKEDQIAGKVASDAAIVFSPFVVKQNKGSGPQGQTSKMQIKKVPFKGVK